VDIESWLDTDWSRGGNEGGERRIMTEYKLGFAYKLRTSTMSEERKGVMLM